MKKIKLSVAAAALAMVTLLSPAAHAGKAIGKVNLVYTQGDLVFVSIAGYNASTGNDASGCSTIGEMALDGSTSAGKNLYAMLLTARALEAEVAFTGTGACTLNGARENIAYGALRPAS